ncbi:MAG: hypothetical protein IT435_05600 [Phycisphaerales bacterium]|nr:hypothetical protein [Phycisphaerales bacterium]
MKHLSAGPTGAMLPGKEYEVAPGHAQQLIQGRHAELVNGDDIAKLETATLRTPETAATRSAQSAPPANPAAGSDTPQRRPPQRGSTPGPAAPKAQ